ncbi:hypothetical protein TNCV_2156721 [Trichonephila clavipes]|nr:hypothetical protein TNCV_2156721 [Trichonephila clavipes]
MEVAEMSRYKKWVILNGNPFWVPGAPRKAAVAHFRSLTGQYCLKSPLYRIGPTPLKWQNMASALALRAGSTTKARLFLGCDVTTLILHLPTLPDRQFQFLLGL